MKCPSCGAEMPEGRLYCEHCGQDIHVVPDFDPALEQQISQSMQEILAGLGEKTEELENAGEDSTISSEIALMNASYGQGKKKALRLDNVCREGKNTGKRKTRKKVHATGKSGKNTGSKKSLAWCISTAVWTCAICLALLGGGGLFLWQRYSLDYQTSSAARCVLHGEYEKAEKHYFRAMQLSPTDMELSLLLAKCYLKQGKEAAYEEQLLKITQNPHTDTQQLQNAYEKLIQLYRSREEYGVISRLLECCDSPSVKEKYRDYLAQPPLFNYECGEYTSMIPLKLSSQAKGQIYYTMDGSEPDRNSHLYVSPILLDSGRVEVKAIFINTYGVESEIAQRVYDIQVPEEEN